MSLKKSYDPFELELYWLKQWEGKSLYSYNFENSSLSNYFCIQLPPPNVTGTLHMGHAFNQTLMDTLIRWQRMKSGHFTTNKKYVKQNLHIKDLAKFNEIRTFQNKC